MRRYGWWWGWHQSRWCRPRSSTCKWQSGRTGRRAGRDQQGDSDAEAGDTGQPGSQSLVLHSHHLTALQSNLNWQTMVQEACWHVRAPAYCVAVRDSGNRDPDRDQNVIQRERERPERQRERGRLPPPLSTSASSSCARITAPRRRTNAPTARSALPAEAAGWLSAALGCGPGCRQDRGTRSRERRTAGRSAPGPPRRHRWPAGARTCRRYRRWPG